MKMELSVKERLVLENILPKQGSVVTYRLIESLRGVIGFSESELVRWVPTICYDISLGCPRCKGMEWKSLPFAPIQRCDGEEGCGFLAGIGPPGATAWRSLDEEGQSISDIAEVEFGEAGLALIADTLRLFDKNEEINEDLEPLYAKFVENEGASVEDGG